MNDETITSMTGNDAYFARVLLEAKNNVWVLYIDEYSIIETFITRASLLKYCYEETVLKAAPADQEEFLKEAGEVNFDSDQFYDAIVDWIDEIGGDIMHVTVKV